MEQIINIMRIITLFPAAIIACGITYLLIYGHPFLFGPYILIAIMSLGVLFLWFAVRGHILRDRIMILSGFAFGCAFCFIGLFVGVFGAIYLYPNSNLAPILGFFQTAPIGLVAGITVGVTLGLFYSNMQIQK